MQVVAIEGSPQRGNTHARVERLGQALVDLGDVEFRHIALRDVDLKPCRGCFRCFDRGADACPLKDDREPVERAMADADGVVFASPVYSMNVSYLMKQFVDRLAYTFHRPRYFGKYAVGLAVAGGIGLKETLEYIRMFSGAWGFEYAGDLRYVDPPRNTSMVRLMVEKDRTEEVARRFHHLMATKPRRRLRRDDYLMFYAMRAVYGRMEPYSRTDHAYWKGQGWLEPDARYFTDHVRAGFLKSIYPRALAWLMGRAIDRRIAELTSGGESEREGAGSSEVGERNGEGSEE